MRSDVLIGSWRSGVLHRHLLFVAGPYRERRADRRRVAKWRIHSELGARPESSRRKSPTESRREPSRKPRNSLRSQGSPRPPSGPVACPISCRSRHVDSPPWPVGKSSSASRVAPAPASASRFVEIALAAGNLARLHLVVSDARSARRAHRDRAGAVLARNLGRRTRGSTRSPAAPRDPPQRGHRRVDRVRLLSRLRNDRRPLQRRHARLDRQRDQRATCFRAPPTSASRSAGRWCSRFASRRTRSSTSRTCDARRSPERSSRLRSCVLRRVALGRPVPRRLLRSRGPHARSRAAG